MVRVNYKCQICTFYFVLLYIRSHRDGNDNLLEKRHIMTKVAAFVVHLPRLSATQVAKLLDWVGHRCIDSQIVTGAHNKDDIYAVLLEARDERNLKNLLCTNFKNWDINKNNLPTRVVRRLDSR